MHLCALVGVQVLWDCSSLISDVFTTLSCHLTLSLSLYHMRVEKVYLYYYVHST